MNKVKAGKDDLSKPIREIFIKQLSKGNSIRMIIRGSSMRPFIRKSDMVTVKPIKFEETKVGDVVAYTRNLHHGFTVHRLIRKSRDHEGRECLTTKGDVSIHGDFPVYPEDIYGKVITIERNAKVINLETRFRCSLGYLIAYLSYGLALGREMVFQPHLFLIRIWRTVKR
jgi:signal peptidase I